MNSPVIVRLILEVAANEVGDWQLCEGTVLRS